MDGVLSCVKIGVGQWGWGWRSGVGGQGAGRHSSWWEVRRAKDGGVRPWVLRPKGRAQPVRESKMSEGIKQWGPGARQVSQGFCMR